MSSLKDQIVTELKSRIYTISTDVKIIEGTGGFWGKWGRDLPVIHLFENISESKLEKPGLYRTEWDIQIEYVRRIDNTCKNLYTEGRKHLQALQAAIEIDKDFVDRITGERLVYYYFKSADEIIEVSYNIVNTAAIYSFIFFEDFGWNDNVKNCSG